MDRLKVKKGNIFIYLGLLVATLLVMIFTRGIAYNNVTKNTDSSDTIIVGIQISPIGVSTHGDTLDGFYYDMFRQIAFIEKINIKIEGFSQIPTAFKRLKDGNFDVVVANLPDTAGLKEKYLIVKPIYIENISYTIGDSIHLVKDKEPHIITNQTQLWVLSSENVELAERLNDYISRIKATQQYEKLVEKYTKPQ